MRNALILAAVLLLPGCATFSPDTGETITPPTFHWHDYTPKNQADLFDVNISGTTLKLGH